MAQRRMFSPDIVESDAFLEMPISSQSLYFHLGMYADDDGFVNPKKIMRMLGVSEDDIKVLIGKRFVLPFESGVVVIKHWKVNNLVRKDWYKPSQYSEEKKLLFTKENGAYTLDSSQNSILVNEPLTIRQHRLGKVRLGNNTYSSISYLSDIPLEDLKEFTERFDATLRQIKDKAESLKLYCESKGRIYKNYKAFLLNALKKDFKERPPKKEASPPLKEDEATPEQRQELARIRKEISSSMTLKK